MPQGLVEVAYGEYPEPAGGWKEGGGYAYWNGLGVELGLGDVVLVPGTIVHPNPQPATVVRTSSDYTGPTKCILYLLKKRSKPKRRKSKATTGAS